MLVPKDIHTRIGDIIERSYTDFTYQLLGKDFLTAEQQTQVEALGLLVGRRPLLELIYILVKQRAEERYQSDRTLTDLLDEIFATGILPKLPETAQFTIDNAMIAMSQIIDNAKADAANAVTNEIKAFNREEQAHERQLIGVYLPVAEQEERNESQAGLLIAALGAALLLVNKKFHRDFTGEFTTLVNHAAVDAAYEAGGSDAKEQLCYKKVMNDSRICSHCHGKYVAPDGTPVIYKLSELIANGSNMGRAKSDWKPVIENDHPRCRCQLILMNYPL